MRSFILLNDEVNFNFYESIGVVTNSLKPSFSEMEITIKEIETLFKRRIIQQRGYYKNNE